MQLTLPEETVLKTGLLTAMAMPRVTQIVALNGGQTLVGQIGSGATLA